MKKLLTMREALASPNYFAPLIGADSWAPWRALLIAIMGEDLTPAERKVFHTLTGRDREPAEPVDEFWGVIGRRGGKSRAISVLASYIAALVDHRSVLAPGERGVLPILAVSVDQASAVFNFVTGTFEAVPRLKALVEQQTADTLSLKTRVDIRVRPASFRTIRSITAVSAIADEIAFWRSDESVNPDEEILAALRPSLLTTGGQLFAISSPHARKGELWRNFRDHHGDAGDPKVLVATGASQVLNSTLPQKEIDRAYSRDAARASAEYGAKFREDIEDFLTVGILDTVIVQGHGENPPSVGVSYSAFTDPSGGRNDGFTLAIAHKADDLVVLDLIAEVRPPFSPDAVVEEFAATLKAYGLTEVTGDKYAGLWPTERFHAHGIKYIPSDMPKSDIYRTVLPLITGGTVKLLDNPRMISQFCSLERRVNRGGRDSIDHPSGQHDDVANSVAGALCLADRVKALNWTDAGLAGLWDITTNIRGDRAVVESWFR